MHMPSCHLLTQFSVVSALSKIVVTLLGKLSERAKQNFTCQVKDVSIPSSTLQQLHEQRSQPETMNGVLGIKCDLLECLTMCRKTKESFPVVKRHLTHFFALAWVSQYVHKPCISTPTLDLYCNYFCLCNTCLCNTYLCNTCICKTKAVC